jgi:hypothetical protein
MVTLMAMIGSGWRTILFRSFKAALRWICSIRDLTSVFSFKQRQVQDPISKLNLVTLETTLLILLMDGGQAENPSSEKPARLTVRMNTGFRSAIPTGTETQTMFV